MNQTSKLAIYLFAGISLLATAAPAADDLPLNPAVSQATITGTVCVAGWTRSIRPLVRTMRIIKAEMLIGIGVRNENRNRYQLDHQIPLALGGAPVDRRNLALQPVEFAKENDLVERCLVSAVCDGRLSLDEARIAIWRDWRAAGTLCNNAKNNPGAF